jgi:hypothetical protein
MEKYLGVKLIEAESAKGYNNKLYTSASPAGVKTEEGYKVKYEDGYESWSPKEVFEKAYRKTDGLTFGLAIEALKLGRCIARKGWNGKGMFICKQVPAEIYCNIIPKMSSLPEDAKVILFDRDKSIFYVNQMIIVKPDNTIDSWVASSSDTFAEDWFVINP